MKLDFVLFQKTPHLGLVQTWDGVCLNSAGCSLPDVLLAGQILIFKHQDLQMSQIKQI